MTNISGQFFSILGDPGTVSRDDAIFSGNAIFSARPENIPSSQNIASINCSWVSEDVLSGTGSKGVPLEPTVRERLVGSSIED